MTEHGDAPIFERPLAPWISQGMLDSGWYHLGGAVARAVDIAGVRLPAERIALWGLDYAGSPFTRDADVLDVIRFRQHPLMSLRKPSEDGERKRPWPTYPHDLLAGATIAPVWLLERTRVPAGSELWRIEHSGEQRLLASYDGPAMGWRGGHGYFPPVHFVGTRAKWGDLDVPAELVGEDDVELVVVGRDAPQGFDEVRPDVWRCVVARADVDELFELVLTCTYRDVPCRILQHKDRQSRLLLLDDDPTTAQQLGAEEVDIGIFEITVDTSALQDVSGTTRSLQASS